GRREQEVGGVGGAPQGLRSDGGDVGAVLARDRRIVAKRGQRARDGLRVERTVPADAAAEPGDLGALGEHLDLLPRGGRHEQKRRVRSDVDRGEVHLAYYRRKSGAGNRAQEIEATRSARRRRSGRRGSGWPRTRPGTTRSRSSTADLRTRWSPARV